MNSASMWPLSNEARHNHVISGKTIQDHIQENVPNEIKVSVNCWISQQDQSSMLAHAGGCVLLDSNKHIIARKGDEIETLIATTSFVILYPWDILRVAEDIISSLKLNSIKGSIHQLAVVDGSIHLGEGSTLLPGVYIEGNVTIGKNCKIGPNCYLRGNTSIGDNVHIGQSVEVKNSLIGSNTAVGHLSYVGDSVIGDNVNLGAGTITSNFRHDGANHKSMVNGELLDTGREKFGAIIGNGVHTGIHTSIYPGRKIKSNACTRPGDIVQYDIEI